MDDAVLEPTTDGDAAASAEAPGTAHTKSRADAEALVLRVIASDADSLLRLARRHSLCADDAHDAYQRGLEIFMRHAPRLDPERAGAWLHTVVKHEAMAVRKSRSQLVGTEEVDFDGHVSPADSPEEQAVRFDRVARSAEALQRLKPQEVRALWLRALGHSYSQIAASEGWSYTKVNRCIAEGRKAFLSRYAGIETGEECERWAPILSAIVDGEATTQQVMDVRPHLRNCRGCRATIRELRDGTSSLAGVFPVGLVAASDPISTDGGGLVMRLYEAITGGLHEKATSSALKIQTALEVTSVGKVAAVAASAAAVTGGGVAAVERATGEPTRSQSVVRVGHEQRSTPRKPAVRSSTARAAAGKRPRRARTARASTRSTDGSGEFSVARARATEEFAPTRAASAAAEPIPPAKLLPPAPSSFERRTADPKPAPNHSSEEFSP